MPGAQALGMVITESQFRAVQAANPGIEIEVLQHDKLPDYEVVARVAPRDAWLKHLATKDSADNNRALAEACILLPGPDELRKDMAQRPGLSSAWLKPIKEMAGETVGARHVATSANPRVMEALERLRADNPGFLLEVLQHDRLPDEAIARVPREDAYRIYEKLRDEGRLVDAVEAICAFSILYPEKAELLKSYEAHPALEVVWAGEIVEMAGFSKGARRKKF